MKLRHLLLSNILLFIFGMGLIANPVNETIKTESDKITLLAAIERISQEYEVYFTFDMTLVSDVEVDYENISHASAEEAISHILKGTNLKYKFYDHRFVILYKEDAEGLESLKQMSRHLDGLISEGERTITSAPKREIRAVPRLSLKLLSREIQRIAFTVEGKVVDQDGEPLIGVNIQVKGSNKGTASDFDGNFILEDVDDNAILVISYVGYQTQEVPVAGNSKLMVTLLTDSQLLDEVVVVGYGTQKKTSLTSSVSSIEGREINSLPITDLSNAIGGRLSGVIVKQSSGEPGLDGSSMYIRGVSTIGSSSPLLIVDGVPRSFQNLDPNSIESFTVLKDAAAVAPYGVAGANGVILVTTKSGNKGKPVVNYNGYVGFQNPTMVPNIANSYEFVTLRNIANENDGLPPPYSSEIVQKYKDGSDPDRYPPHYDVYDEIITKNAPINYQSIGISGGIDNINYYFNIGFQDQAGMWSTAYAKKYNFSASFDGHLTPTTSFSIRLNGANKLSNHPATTHDGSTGSATTRVFELAKYAVPGTGGPLFFTNGMIGHHLSAAIWGSGYRKFDRTSLYSQIELKQDITFVKGLSIGGKFAFDPGWNEEKLWSIPNHIAIVDNTKDPYEIVDAIYGKDKATLSQNFSQINNKLYQGNVEFINRFSNHGIQFIGVFEAIKRKSHSLSGQRRNYVLGIDELSMGSSSNDDFSNGGNSSEATQVGLVYRLSYDYNNKYLLELSGRYDGHYYFAPDQRFGFFPAFSIGWRLSEEKFMKNNLPWIYNLKLRASYGQVGALAGGPFQYLSTYGVSGPGYVIGGNGVQVVSERSEPNTNITWERANKSDVGVEVSLWKGKVNLEADYFYEKRSNMLINPDVITPLEYGIGLSQVNEAIMSNRGIELLMNLNFDLTKDLYLGLTTTFTSAKNKLIQIYESSSTYNNPNRRLTGRPLGMQFGYKALGYFQTDDFDSEGNLLPEIPQQPWGKVQPGDIRYLDANGDGVFNSEDYVPIGDPATPGFIYGFTPAIKYKNFGLDVLFQGIHNSNFYLEGSGIWSFETGRTAFMKNYDYWTPENPDAFYPRLEPVVSTNNRQRSSKWMMDVSYMRLKNINFSYSLPSDIMQKMRLDNCLIYISGQNIHTWAGDILEFADPENLSSGGYFYPQQKVISIGLQLSF